MTMQGTHKGRGRGRGRVVVITGASSGIGEACALRLDELGFRVFASVRKEEDAEALKGKASCKLTPLFLDVTDQRSIAAATRLVGETVAERGLWGLVNNAGIAVAGPLDYLPVDELRKQLEVNVVGQVAVTQALLPLLRMSRGRIVNIGSISGRVSVPLLGPYSASKFALEAITDALRMELESSGIKVSIVAPAGIATPIWEKSLAAAERLAADYPPELEERYGKMRQAQTERAMRSASDGVAIEEVVRVVVHALTARKPKTRYTVGSVARVGEILRILPDRVRERLLLRQFAR